MRHLRACGKAAAMGTLAVAAGAGAWADGHRVPDPAGPNPLFSFAYDGRPSGELLAGWRVRRTVRQLGVRRAQRTTTWVDSATGLRVQCRAVTYRDYPAVEWTLTFENTGKADTPVLSDLMPLDATVYRAEGAPAVLHHFAGSPCTATDYAPQETPLAPGTAKRLAAAGGRPTNVELPFVNVAGHGSGVIAALGWPGQWAATVSGEADGSVRMRGGQELTRLRLKPGERIRTPLVVLLPYNGAWTEGQNVWRRWMLAHNVPRGRAGLPDTQWNACSSHQFNEMLNANEANQVQFVDRYQAEGLGLDYWWMDAGWYPNSGGWGNTGTWEVDTRRFPRGLRHITDHARASGIRSIVWFEPERVNAGTWLFTTHPEWLLGEGENRLLDLGNPEAWRWLVDHLDRTIREQGIDLYRTDFNFDPLPFWRSADAPDRQGMTEIRYCEGFLAYLDELKRRHPRLRIDTCASGGRRNDLETLRRAVPLLRSDYIFEPAGQQNHTYGISFWIPWYGTGQNATEPYSFRSQMCPSNTACYDVRRTDLDYAALRKLYQQWRRVVPAWQGDYYPLTPYDPGQAAWMAFQFDRPRKGSGVVLAFRRPEARQEALVLKLQGLRRDRAYMVRDEDSGREVVRRGSELMEAGLEVRLAQRPASAVIVYRLKGRG